MAELGVIEALREKRSELNGVLSRLEQQLAQHRGSLAHLDATMRLSIPTCCPRTPTRLRSGSGCRGFVPANAAG